ncbi:MAG: molybdate ABC transporter substrate-binding protein [Armatimonadetes bacterium]|nr:molybdate ABC transporter substrate-binding protein [Armatimonadota bacterium]MDW8121382.1 molybdate ABC transporter substrate-binding protein [Armatimonadota bacterium]
MRRAVVGILLIFVLGTAAATPKGSPADKKSPAKVTVPVKREGWRVTIGWSDAKVKVEAFYPLGVVGGEGHDWVLEYAMKIAQAHPKKVLFTIYDFTTPKGSQEWQKRGLTCGAFLIGGKFSYTFKGGKTVAFMRSEALGGWTFDQLKTAVAQEVEKAYKKEPAGGKGTPVKKTSLRLESRSSTGFVEIYVPCGLAGPYGEIARAFQKAHPDITLRPTVSGVVALLNALRDYAKPDIYLALGTYELTHLAEKGRFVEGSMVTVAQMPLGLIVHRKNPAGIKTLNDLTSPRVKTIVTYSYQLSGGRAAKQALQKAGIWEQVKGKIVTPKVPDLAKQMLKKGQATVGILYTTCLKESYVPDQPPVEEKDLRVIQTLPPDSYEPIYVAAVQLKDGPNPEAAKQFLEFLKRRELSQIWRKWGFREVKGAPLASSRRGRLLVFAGAAFRPPLEEMAKAFQKKYGIPVQFNFTGSNCLLAQIILTQKGDLFLPGEDFYVEQAEARGYVVKKAVLGYFIPVILVRKGNPKGIKSLADLAKPGLRVGLGDPRACAIGAVGEEVLKKNGLAEKVRKNVVLRAVTAPELANALRLGAIDACLNWDAIANYPWVRPAVEVITIPPHQNLVTSNPLAILKTASHPQEAELFFEFAQREGQKILQAHGFTTRDGLPKALRPFVLTSAGR